MMEKRRANQVYSQIKQRRVDPGILQTTDGPGGDGTSSSSTGFSAKIFPINPYGTKRLEMEYTEELPVEGLMSHFMFPLKPSYGEAQTVGEFNLTLRVLSDMPIEPVQTDNNSFPLQVTRSDPNEFAAEYHAQNLKLTSDLSFDYKIAVDADTFSVTAHRAPERPSVYDPSRPAAVGSKPGRLFRGPRRFSAGRLINNSRQDALFYCSTRRYRCMATSSRRAVEAADFFLHSLRPEDQFNLILFNEQAVPFSQRPVAATPDEVEQALQFVRNSSIGGGNKYQTRTRAGGGTGESIFRRRAIDRFGLGREPDARDKQAHVDSQRTR